MCADRWTDFVPKVAEQREVCFASVGGGRRQMVQKGLQGILRVMKLWWRRKAGHGNNRMTWRAVGHLALGELFTV